MEIFVVDGMWTPYRSFLPSDEQLLLSESYRSVEIVVNGAYETDGRGGSTCNDLDLKGCPMPDENWGKLIARIGLGDPFSIGSKLMFTATDTGLLQLRMNEIDSGFENNSGVLAININVEQP